MNQYIHLTLENMDQQHLCCAISDKKHQEGVTLKKEWLKERIKEGHVFRKLDVKGKVFVEYAPLESAWVPIEGNHFMYIYCLWVSGSYKKNGYGKELLEYVIQDAQKQNKNGICVLSSKKKKPFLSDSKFFKKYGFQVVDQIGDYELLALCFHDDTPQFCDNARQMKIDNPNLTIFYTYQCPFTSHCIQEIKDYCQEHQIKLCLEHIDTLKKAKEVPCVFQNWATFKDGEFVSNTLFNKNMLKKLYL